MKTIPRARKRRPLPEPPMTAPCLCGHDYGSHDGKRCTVRLGAELTCACLGFKLAAIPADRTTSIRFHEAGGEFVGAAAQLSLDLKVDERRLEEAAARDGYVTGCFVRAKTRKGWESVDMWCLTRESLLAWIETRGPVGPFAKSVILILAGYRPEGPAMGGGPDT
jgi:hypothetical protein